MRRRFVMSQPENNKPVALTIAGLDPSGSAGVIADIRTFTTLGCLSTAAITSLTFQNDVRVWGAEHVSPETLRAQVLPIVNEHSVAGAKTGMLPTREIVHAIAGLFRETKLPAPVVDPILRSTSGYALIEAGALEALLAELLPLARIITPNIPEAEQITGLSIVDEAGMRRAAKMIRELGARAVLIKGGHLQRQEAGGRRQPAAKPASSSQAIDVLDDEGTVTVLRGSWIEADNVRGTGCMLSAAIAACLAKGMKLEIAVAAAKRFVSDAISRSAA